MGIFDDIRNMMGQLSRERNKVVNQVNRYNILDQNYKNLNEKHNTLNKKYNNMYGKLIDTKRESRRNASKRFNYMKGDYQNRINLINRQQELSNDKNNTLLKNKKMYEKNNLDFEANKDKVSTYSRKLLYDKKDLKFYDLAIHILKFFLLVVSISVIYLLLKKKTHYRL